jgi:outer membrane murein-binding lipoprotein Lpp
VKQKIDALEQEIDEVKARVKELEQKREIKDWRRRKKRAGTEAPIFDCLARQLV